MLRQLVITRNIADTKKALDAITQRGADFEERRKALEAREAELAAAIEEVTEDTPKEDREAVEKAIDEHTQEADRLASEIETSTSEIETLTKKIDDLERELEALNTRAKPVQPINTISTTASHNPRDERRSETIMSRMKFFRNMPLAECSAILERAEVKDFTERARAIMQEKRTVTGGELLIPDVLLGLLRDNLHIYSKLISRVNLRRVPGTSRLTIAGTIPEGVWTEMCATLNQLSISFNQIEVDGYKVGGFIPVCNALLEDSNINLVDEIFWNIGQAIGFALDKAILYGTGTKMPLGIMTRLAQAAAPTDQNPNAPPWTYLAVSNLLKVDGTTLTDIKFYQALILAIGVPRQNYSNGVKFWAMNSSTYASLQAKALVRQNIKNLTKREGIIF